MCGLYFMGVRDFIRQEGAGSAKAKGGVQLAENNEKTTKRKGNNGNGFKKGQSGNPGGRPKRTDEEIGVLEEIKKLAANVPKVLQTILENEASSPAYRLKAAEIILDRTCGKADAHVSIDAEIKPKGDFVIEIGEESENESDN